MEFQQIGMSHPAVKDVLAIQNNTARNRFGFFVAEGLWAAKVALDTGLRVDTFFWCHELANSGSPHWYSSPTASRSPATSDADPDAGCLQSKARAHTDG